MPGLQPDTSITEILQHVFQTTIAQNRDAEKPGKYQATVVRILGQPTNENEFIPAFDPFWSATDDETRFSNMGVISDKVSGKTVAIVSVSPVFTEIFHEKELSFDYSTLLRLPYTKELNGGAELEKDHVVEMTFSNRTTLEGPVFVKKAAPKLIPVFNTDASKPKKSVVPDVDRINPCGPPKEGGAPEWTAGKCKCNNGYEWNKKEGRCLCPTHETRRVGNRWYRFSISDNGQLARCKKVPVDG